jgi:hypothetical protein
MHAERPRTAGIGKDVDGIFGVGMDIAEDGTGLVCANGDEAEIKGASVLADLRKGWAAREV